MNYLHKLTLLCVFLVLTSCAKDKPEISTLKETDQELEMISAYKEGFVNLNNGDHFFAAKKFLEAEMLYPQSSWAPKASLMASYAYYLQGNYSDAKFNLERFITTYPSDKRMAYAQFLLAICYYDIIEDEKKDIEPLLVARAKFNYIVEKYPNTDFAIDAKFKIEFITDMLAAKEMYIGRHYIKKEKWIPAINRFKNVITEYDTSIYAEEAIHRLVELHYRIGLIEESKKYASMLGYNYLSSEWYKKSYKIFNKNYKPKETKRNKVDKKSTIDKFKKLFE